MKLYLVDMLDPGKEGHRWDYYDQYVCAAKDEEQARAMGPRWPEGPRYTWSSDPTNVKVTLLGNAVRGTQQSIICASFNAG